MRCILLAPIHGDTFTQSLPFPRWQAQAGWFKALQELGVKMQPHIYSNHLLGDFFAGMKSIPLVHKVEWRLASSGYDKKWRQRKLMEEIESFFPDVIFISGGAGLASLGSDIGRKIKTRFSWVRLVLFNGMKPIYAGIETEKHLLPFVDLVVTNDHSHAKIWEQYGAKKTVALPISAIDPDLFPKKYLEEPIRKEGIIFVGSLFPADQYLERLTYLWSLHIFNISIHTKDKNVNPWMKFEKFIKEQQMIDRYRRSAIGLNIHGESYMPDGANLRTFELAASGCFQLVDHVMSGIFEEGKEIVSFSDTKDLGDKVEYYLQHVEEREAIASAAMKKVFEQHTFARRFQKILEILKCN